jgi:hypothetical protein
MAWDPTPWFVEGGAQHSANIARKFAFAAVGGQEGIVGSGDLEVRELAVPSTKVRVFPGLAAILNRAVGLKNEMYMASLITEDLADIAASTASGPRSDMIIARIENPFPTGEPWPDPTDPTVGPYVKTVVLSNVGNTAKVVPPGLGYTAIPLARIDLPASTGTIIQSYITDLRPMAPVLRRAEKIMMQAGVQHTLFSTTVTAWPNTLNIPVKIPSWATKATINGLIAGVRLPPGNARGDIRGGLGTLRTQVNIYDDSNSSSGDDRTSVVFGGGLDIPASMRGTTANIIAEARKYTAGDITTSLVAEAYTTCTVEVEFSAEPASNL